MKYLLLVCLSVLLIYCNNQNEKVNSAQADDHIKFLIEIDNEIAELCNNGEDIQKLNASQKTFYFIQNLDREIHHGGFYQFFYNSSGNFTHETITALSTIGANTTCSIVLKAIEYFPNKTVPTNRAERIRILESVEVRASEEWNYLDNVFYNYEDDLTQLCLDFINKNRIDFNLRK